MKRKSIIFFFFALSCYSYGQKVNSAKKLPLELTSSVNVDSSTFKKQAVINENLGIKPNVEELEKGIKKIETKETLSFKNNDTIQFKDGSVVEILNNSSNIRVLEKKVDFDWVKYVLPIVTLFLGFFVNKIWDWYLDQKKILDNKMLWLTELENLNTDILNFINDFKKFLNEDIENYPGCKLPAISIKLKASAFQYLDKTFLLKYLKKTKLGNEKLYNLYSKIHRTIDLVQENYSQFNKVLVFSGDLIKENQKQFNFISAQFRNSLYDLNKYISNNIIDSNNGLSKEKFDEIESKYQEMREYLGHKKFDFNFHHNHFVNFFKERLIKFGNIEEVKNTINILVSFSDNYEEFKSIKNSYIDFINSIILDFEERQESISDIISNLKKQ